MLMWLVTLKQINNCFHLIKAIGDLGMNTEVKLSHMSPIFGTGKEAKHCAQKWGRGLVLYLAAEYEEDAYQTLTKCIL